MRSFSVLIWLEILLLSGLAVFAGEPPSPRVEIERVPVSNGAELLTVFERGPVAPGGSGSFLRVPLVSILRDTLGDPQTPRLRQLWILTYARPSLSQRLAAILPFFYHRAAASAVSANRPPAPLMDLAAPGKNTLPALAAAILQSEVVDGEGVLWRASTREYRSASGDYRNMRIAEGLATLEVAAKADSDDHSLSADQWKEIRARLILGRRLFGGLARRDRTPEFADRQSTLTNMDRAHNWDLLRQRAEKNGLYFDPASFETDTGSNPEAGSTASFAILWIRAGDLDSNRAKPFDGKLLKIGNPWRDESLKAWKGYQETWYFDDRGIRADQAAPGATPASMIPLALYSLDYPPAPTLLVDFRDQWKPKQREIALRVADYTTAGLLGLSGSGNLSFLAARASVSFYRRRHGANVDRAARLSAYAMLRRSLAFDESLDPKLRAELVKRLEHLSLNPFERGKDEATSVPNIQYAALLAYAKDPGGLPARLDRDRGREAAKLDRSRVAHLFQNAGTVLSLGLYQSCKRVTPEVLARLDRQRRLEADITYLSREVESSPNLDVTADLTEVGRRLGEITQLRSGARNQETELAKLAASVFAKTSDDAVRLRSLNCLASLHSPAARRELERISTDDRVSSTLRDQSVAYLNASEPPGPSPSPANSSDSLKPVTGSGSGQ